MKYDELVRSVAAGTHLTRREADAAILATLTTLAEHLSPEETRDLLAQLPKSFKERVPVTSERSIIDPAAFVRRTAELLDDIAVEDAEAQIRVVFSTLSAAVNAGEMRDVFEQLGDDYADLLDRAPLARGASTPRAHDGWGLLVQRATETVNAVAHVVVVAAEAGVGLARHAVGAMSRLVSRPTPP